MIALIALIFLPLIIVITLILLNGDVSPGWCAGIYKPTYKGYYQPG